MLIYDETSERVDYSEDDAAFDGIADELTDETEAADDSGADTDAGDAAAEDGGDVEDDAAEGDEPADAGDGADASDEPADEEPSVEEETGDDTAETIAALIVDVAGIKDRLEKLENLSDLFVDGGGVIAQADDDDNGADGDIEDVLDVYEAIEDMDFTI